MTYILPPHSFMDATHSENTKRIAKNTLVLYVRMLFSMLVSLYTSRVILNTLGVEDYGIQNVVGGVVGMFGFLNASMSGATSRFLTFELGKGDKERLQLTFNCALFVHVLIAFVVVVLVETIGLWFMVNKLVIPEERMMAAHVVFQCAVLGMAVGIIQVPYNESIISHERMDVYAYVEMVNVFIRLAVVFLLVWSPWDKLIFLALLNLLVGQLIALFYRYYCRKNFKECNFRYRLDKKIIKSMTSFTGWDLFGNMSVMARTQGVSMLINVFFGPVMNAAMGIATQVQGVVMSFGQNIVTAVRPQIVKTYAQSDFGRMEFLVINTSKLVFSLLLFLSLPIMLETEYILSVWLGQYPEYTVAFCQWTLVFNFFASMSVLVVSVVHATGKIWRPSLINGSLYILVIPLSYIAFRCGASPVSSFVFNAIAVFFGMLSNAWTVRLYVPSFSFTRYVLQVALRCSALFALSGICVLAVQNLVELSGFYRFLVTGSVSVFVVAFGALYVLFDSKERVEVIRITREFIWNKIRKG